MNAYEVRQAWCLLQVKLCDPCLSALKWFVYHARRYTSARLYFTLLYITVRKCDRLHVCMLAHMLAHSHINDEPLSDYTAALHRLLPAASVITAGGISLQIVDL